MECHFQTENIPNCSGSVVSLKDCNRNIDTHLVNIHQSQSVGITSERSLILSRSGIFGALQNTTHKDLICQNHRDRIGRGFIAHRTCQHPRHNTKQAAEKRKTVPLWMSKEIFDATSDIVPVGEGENCESPVPICMNQVHEVCK